jgi:ubiquinone/menaquinone biosynthesis C-methylase UbiE
MLSSKANWDNLWKKPFEYGPLETWGKEIFILIADLLKDVENPRILSAGCGRGLVDYWLVKVFGHHVTFMDYSEQCIKNLKKSLNGLKQDRFELCHGSIFEIPYPDQHFDMVWNAGVLEHFDDIEYNQALSEMKRVSKGFVLVDIPNAQCKPYLLAKKWLEENDLWMYGFENPRETSKEDFSRHHIELLMEKYIGGRKTCENYIKMVPTEFQDLIRSRLVEEDYEMYPHLLSLGKVIHS